MVEVFLYLPQVGLRTIREGAAQVFPHDAAAVVDDVIYQEIDGVAQHIEQAQRQQGEAIEEAIDRIVKYLLHKSRYGLVGGGGLRGAVLVVGNADRPLHDREVVALEAIGGRGQGVFLLIVGTGHVEHAAHQVVEQVVGPVFVLVGTEGLGPLGTRATYSSLIHTIRGM